MTATRNPGHPSQMGSYQLIRPLAQGGMAELYLARDPAGGEVALKVLSASRAADAEACAMFLDEARVVAMLHHDNIASVVEVDVADGQHYLAMEFVDGADLREIALTAQRANRTVPYDAAVAIVVAAAAGLDHAHRRCRPDGSPLRLVHRDVSLSNIMVSHDGAVKVVDFGIATTTMASVHTLPGVVRGKASYMSPEQCLGDRVDHRSDVFALGVVLYELTTGARCFHGRSDFERMLAVVRTDYLLPSALVADFPPALEAIIRTALMADPERRFASAAAMIEALAELAARAGWDTGAQPIRALMQALFASAAAGAEQFVDGEPATERCSILALPAIAEPTRPQRRLARGTEHGPVTDDELDEDSDERTRGRAPLRRLARGSAPRLRS